MSLLDRLGALPDGRRGHGLRHRQRFVLVCAVVCMLMGACHDHAFENTCKKFTERQLRALGCTPEQEIGPLVQLAVGGKVQRGSGRHDCKPLQLLSAVTHHLRLTLDQVTIQKKSNEIPALKPLLKKLDLLPGTLITADAMHRQQECTRFIIRELGGDYLFGLKGNTACLHDSSMIHAWHWPSYYAL